MLLDKVSKAQFKDWINEKQFSDGFTPLHYAAYNSNLSAIVALLKHGADPNARSRYGMTVLHVAAQSNSVAPLYFFKQLGVSINI